MSLATSVFLAVSMSFVFFQPITQSSQDRVPFPAYSIVPGRVDPERLDGYNAQLCIGAAPQQNCFPSTSKHRETGVPFGAELKATKIDLEDGGSLLLLTANFDGGGSGGPSTSVALLECRRDGHLRNLLPAIEVSSQSEFRVWNLPGVFHMPLFLTADFDWHFEPGETHYGRHRYWIEGYAFDRKTRTYKRAMKYLTRQAYPGLNDADKVVVLEPERSTIVAKLSPALRKRR